MATGTITPQGLKDALGREPNLRLIDVRFPVDFRAVHVTGAENIPFNRLSAEQFSALASDQNDSPVYFICKLGKKSREVCQQAVESGLTNVMNVEGGTEACVAAGLPLERGEQAVSLERQVRITAGALVFLGAVLAMAVNPYWAILPAFIGAGLVFSGVTDSCGMGMMLAKMPWNR